MARVATIDIGTSSVLLLIAEGGREGARAVLERATITRLGEGVDRTRRLAPAACERTLDCLRAYAADIAAAGTPQYRYAGIYTIEAEDPAPVFEEMMRRYASGEMTACPAMDAVSYNGIFAGGPVITRS